MQMCLTKMFKYGIFYFFYQLQQKEIKIGHDNNNHHDKKGGLRRKQNEIDMQ